MNKDRADPDVFNAYNNEDLVRAWCALEEMTARADKEQATAIHQAVWALKKQISKNVLRSVSKGFICPSCGLKAVVLESYCHYCGQKLQWNINENNI